MTEDRFRIFSFVYIILNIYVSISFWVTENISELCLLYNIKYCDVVTFFMNAKFVPHKTHADKYIWYAVIFSYCISRSRDVCLV